MEDRIYTAYSDFAFLEDIDPKTGNLICMGPLHKKGTEEYQIISEKETCVHIQSSYWDTEHLAGEIARGTL